MAILVTGGAGYIGSVTVEIMRRLGKDVVILDNLAYGHERAVFENVPFYDGDIGDTALVNRIVTEHGIDACIHFAAFTYVGESVEKPAIYYGNNVGQGLRLLDALIGSGVKYVVFSSTCAVYGEPVRLPIDETHPQQPTSPYGMSKHIVEQIMKDYDRAYGLRFVALRYFNAAGATEQRGEDHAPETHLIPLVLFTALGQRPYISVFGNDYPTPDGTCVRDYIHVEDLANAHVAALDYLRSGGESTAINLGNGQGYTVLEVINAARKVTGRQMEIRFAARRAGDPSHLVADATKAHDILKWRPTHSSLDAIIGSAWAWHQQHPNGYS